MDHSDHDGALDWLTIAQTALSAYALYEPLIDWLAHTHNAVFRVQAGAERFVLRIGKPGLVSPAWLASELVWLRYLGDETDITAPYPLQTTDGGLFTSVPIAGAETVLAALFRYVDGEPRPADSLTPDDMGAVGGLLALLHNAADAFVPPPDFDRPRLDWDGLFGSGSIYDPGDAANLLRPDQVAVLDAVAVHLRDAMAALDQSAPHFGLIHADLLAKNILFHHGQPRPLDFAYCGWGYALYDLAPLLWQLRGLVPDDAQLEEPLWAGYVAGRPALADQRGTLERFIAARQMASCRWLLGNLDHPAVRDHAPALLTARIDELRAYLDTGRLHRQSRTL